MGAGGLISFDDVDHFTSVMSTLILTYVHIDYVRNPDYPPKNMGAIGLSQDVLHDVTSFR